MVVVIRGGLRSSRDSRKYRTDHHDARVERWGRGGKSQSAQIRTTRQSERERGRECVTQKQRKNQYDQHAKRRE